ncbi:DNA excision repair protein ERCC-2 [Oxalobacteraceae bacterium GrIS 2.11]
MSEAAIPAYTIAVRALCEFTAKCGDLDLRFTPGPSAEEGIAGHAAVRARRRAGYQSEVSLEGVCQQLRVRGRADGYDPAANEVEEIKTYRGDLTRMADNHRQLHWAQAKIYGYLLCKKFDLSEINVVLVYYEIAEQTETRLVERYSSVDLQLFFEDQCGRFLAWAVQELQHRMTRDDLLQSMKFPYPDFRTGQRKLAQAVYKAATQACCLMAQAPTGIGKTIGTLFPLLKAAPAGRLDKIFYLAAKTSGRQLALDGLALIRQSAPRLRVLELIARDKACEHPDKACHGESCPLAQGFYDRLPEARRAMLDVAVFDKATTREVALAHQICPYYLSQEMVRWSDVVVADYNYYFDVSALLHAMSSNYQWQVGVLVDEAHNLVERARKMYSAELDQSKLKLLRALAPPELKGSLDRLNRSWNAIGKDQGAAYQTYPDIPDTFILALQKVCVAIGDYLVAHPATVEPRLQQFFFDAQLFIRLAEVFGDHSLFDVTFMPGQTSGRRLATLCIRNVVPAPFLKPRFDTAHTTTLFSATLGPWQFYSDMFGTPPDTPWIEVESPFDAAQLTVQITPHISTRYRERTQSLAPIVTLMSQQFAARPGNYFAFFSSFDYLQNVLDVMRKQSPLIPVWEQSRAMSEADRDNFLARFKVEGQGIGFAVLGGAFAEAIDLPGERLIGAFIATLGLPQTNEVNEQLRIRMQKMFCAGYEYAYLYPGLQKVVQAAGRVIRTTSDQGAIFLMDDRFDRHEVKQLLPAWWNLSELT